MAEPAARRKVNVIPARKRHLQNGDQFRTQKELRVAAYCRVSTEEESQETSYTGQKNHYTALITGRPGWTLAGIYADEGKTGTTRKGRIRFNELIADCKAGRIDYIITKSISRFARNTVDALDCVHELQRLHPPVGVYFERENIDTLNANSEMFLTFYCSMAQEESHSISENIKWSLQKNFRSGKPQINLRRMLGYDMCREGHWTVNEEEAVTVCYIYGRFLEGGKANAIARELNEAGRGTVNGKRWRADAVLYILRNEKYAGDVIMQKTYTESYLTHKAVRNTGELPQYFIENHHPAIISREVWNKTQELLMYRQRGRSDCTQTVQTKEGEVEIRIGYGGRNTQEAYMNQMERTPAKGGPPNPFAILTCARCGARMKRMCYNAYLPDYTDGRSLAGRGKAGAEKADYTDSYTFSYGVWKCPCGGTRKAKAGSTGKSAGVLLPEISISQSFMEMLYRIRDDVASRGEQADIVVSFRRIYDLLCRKKACSGLIEQKLRLLEMEIDGLEKSYREAAERLNMYRCAAEIRIGGAPVPDGGNPYAELTEDLKRRMEEKQAEKQYLMGESGVTGAMKDNFDAFLSALEKLPGRNPGGCPGLAEIPDAAGNPRAAETPGTAENPRAAETPCAEEIPGAAGNPGAAETPAAAKAPGTAENPRAAETQDAAGTPETPETPELLPLDEYIFLTYILRMEADGDEIRYGTSFGLSLTSTGNSRPLKSYLGYRKTEKKTGESVLITKLEQLASGSIQHHRKKRKRSAP